MAGSIRYGDMIKTRCLSNLLDFTRYAFKVSTNNKFVIGEHHKIICNALDRVIKGECKRLIINIAPRYSKTLIAVRSFIEYGLCLNPAAKFLHLSYSDDLVLDSSRAIRETLQLPEMQEIFGVNITSGNAKKWYTNKGGGLYAVSTGGQVTGFGAGNIYSQSEEQREIDSFIPYYDSSFSGAIIIDDPIKPEDALSDNLREQVNRRFETTIRNRVNSRETPIIIIMQRLHPRDLCGYLLETEADEWEVLSLPCIQYEADGTPRPLWPFKHTLEELRKIEQANAFVFETQYMQNPQPLEGLMYHEFKTYEIIPPSKNRKLRNYTDTADTGKDYLCSISYEEHPEAIYVIDVLFSKKPMEYTEQALAQMLAKRKIQQCIIESNNGGRTFMRNVERLTRLYDNNVTWFTPITQTKNKNVRIFSRSAEVNNLIIFPHNWETRWPEFARAVKSYRKEGRNAFDDHADCLTGCVEYRGYIDELDEREIFQDFL